MDKKEVGQRIKKIRLEKGMTLEEFGKLFNASKSSVSGWESGKSLPNAERLKTIAKLGDFTVEDLLGLNQKSDYYDWETIKNELNLSDNKVPNSFFNSSRKLFEELVPYAKFSINDLCILINSTITPIKVSKETLETVGFDPSIFSKDDETGRYLWCWENITVGGLLLTLEVIKEQTKLDTENASDLLDSLDKNTHTELYNLIIDIKNKDEKTIDKLTNWCDALASYLLVE